MLESSTRVGAKVDDLNDLAGVSSQIAAFPSFGCDDSSQTVANTVNDAQIEGLID